MTDAIDVSEDRPPDDAPYHDASRPLLADGVVNDAARRG